ncbi:uncharacterized protein [Neodiprion pinetum]|uniref:uncharacterized protein n=1 Tax=Neodiprion pinetum TaxID=441929 RepID=UPI001EE037E7|nr:uncharacterized protein LOC124218505 [Neodiprion pinetum]
MPEFLWSPYVVYDTYDSASDTYSNTKKLLSELKVRVNRNSAPDNLTSQGSLPRIPLPTFSDKYSEWKSFSDLFLSLVGNREDISKVEKLVRLKTALKDEAASLLSNVSVAEDNYAPAWRTLIERYENRRLLASSHLNRLLGLTSLP